MLKPRPPATAVLRELAHWNGIHFGAAAMVEGISGCCVDTGNQNSDFCVSDKDCKAYANLIGEQLSLLTPSNACKLPGRMLSPTDTYFDHCDAIYTFAMQRGMVVRGHPLVWHTTAAEWLRPRLTADATWMYPLAAADLKNATQLHVKAAVRYHVTHFPASVSYAWDVVSEAVEANGVRSDDRGRPHPWFNVLGEKYIDVAFRAARQESAIPLLFLNDVGVASMHGDEADKSEQFYQLLKRLKHRNVPVDGASIELHVETNYKWVAGVAANLERISALGLQVHLTGIDVAVPDGVPWSLAEEQKQAEVYAALLQTCINQSACTAYELAGVTDAHSWKGGARSLVPKRRASECAKFMYCNVAPGPACDAVPVGCKPGVDVFPPYPLPWDAAYQPKLAVRAIRDTLNGNQSWVRSYQARVETDELRSRGFRMDLSRGTHALVPTTTVIS